VQPGQPDLQGVDLRLDSFDLTSVKRMSFEAQGGSWGSEAKPLDDCVSISEAFWAGLEPDSKVFCEEDKELLNEIYNCEICDRRLEGDLFIPPDASHAYVTKLRSLVKAEQDVRSSRKAHFFSKSFASSRPGPLFPAAWSLGFDIASGDAPIRGQSEFPQRVLHAYPDYKQQAEVLLHRVQSSAPIFDKIADGVRFRIYQVGSLEVRTCQERSGLEEVGAVFSMRALTSNARQSVEALQDEVTIRKATEYVEQGFGHDGLYRYFLVLETENGDRIVTERATDGSFTWEENPDDFEDRCSWARALRCHAALPGLSVRDMKVYAGMMTKALADDTSSASKRYSRSLYLQAVASSQGFWTLPVTKQR